MPHMRNPERKIPLDRNALASANQTDAENHRERAHAHMPRYEQ